MSLYHPQRHDVEHSTPLPSCCSSTIVIVLSSPLLMQQSNCHRIIVISSSLLMQQSHLVVTADATIKSLPYLCHIECNNQIVVV
jgi:hypothetical protein